MINIFRCRICGEIYLRFKKPSHCPWCLAPGNYIVLIEEWDLPEYDLSPIELGAVSREHLIRVRNMKLDNAQFYRAAAKNSRTRRVICLFKKLSKIEYEHVEIICKTLGLDKPKLEEVETSLDDTENINDARRRQIRALNYYSQVVKEVLEPRVQELFYAFTIIERIVSAETGAC